MSQVVQVFYEKLPAGALPTYTTDRKSFYVNEARDCVMSSTAGRLHVPEFEIAGNDEEVREQLREAIAAVAQASGGAYAVLVPVRACYRMTAADGSLVRILNCGVAAMAPTDGTTHQPWDPFLPTDVDDLVDLDVLRTAVAARVLRS